MFTPIRFAFALTGPARSAVDFSGATVLQLADVYPGDTVSFYQAVAGTGVSSVGVYWSDGDDYGASLADPQVEIVYPDGNRGIVLSHTYRSYTRSPVIKITNGLSELRFSGVTLTSVDRLSVGVKGFTGATKLRSVDNVGSRVSKTLTPGLFSNTGITSIPSGYSLPSISSRKAAPCIPLACFMNCTSLTSLSNLPSGAVAIDALAFSGCSALTSLAGLSSSPGIVHIGHAAFRGCSALTSLSGLAGTLTYDSYNTLFGQWNNMDAVLEEMQPGATRGWRVDQFLLPLGSDAFRDCANLTDISALNISGGFLLPGTFSDCAKLTSIPASIKSKSLGTDTLAVPSTIGTPDSDYYGVFPGGYRFFVLSRWVKSADVYDYLGLVGKDAYVRLDTGGVFDGTAITEIPYSLDSKKLLLWQEFKDCKRLTNVTIPSSIERVGYSVFSGCTALMSVTFQGKTMDQVRKLIYPRGIDNFNIFAYAGRAFPFGLPTGCRITCSDGVITV